MYILSRVEKEDISQGLKLWYQWNDHVSGNIHVRYESPKTVMPPSGHFGTRQLGHPAQASVCNKWNGERALEVDCYVLFWYSNLLATVMCT